MNDTGDTAGEVVVLILGMGRSGSSALARVLALCGGRLPDQLLPPNQRNPTGYWEPRHAVHANARFLQAIGSSFFDTQLVQPIGADSVMGRTFIAEIADILHADRAPASGAPLILKEPRISLLLPFWLPAIAQAGFVPRVVIPVRHPGEVARSLGAWKGLPDAHGAELWLKYNLLAERHTRHLPRTFIGYADLLTDWRTQVGAIADALQLSFPPADAVDDFLNSDLRHTVSSDHDVADEPPCLRTVYQTFAAACPGNDIAIAPLDAAFADVVRAQTAGSRPVVRSFGVDFGVG